MLQFHVSYNPLYQCQNVILKEELRNHLLRDSDSLAETEVALAGKGIQPIYPQWDLKRAKETAGSPPHMYPLVKTEFVYEDDGDNRPQVITKEIPFAATELAKLREDSARSGRESETEYVWRVSLSGATGSCCRKGEREGPGAQAGSSPPAIAEPCGRWLRAMHWAGGVRPAGEGGSPGPDGHGSSVLGSEQRAACLRMLYGREPEPDLSSPVLLPAEPERTTAPMRGLPASLKPAGIQLQGRIQNTPSEERTVAARGGGVTPNHRWPGRKVWTWGETAPELMNCGRRHGPVSGHIRGLEPEPRAAERGSKRLFPWGKARIWPGKKSP